MTEAVSRRLPGREGHLDLIPHGSVQTRVGVAQPWRGLGMGLLGESRVERAAAWPWGRMVGKGTEEGPFPVLSN